MSAYTTYDFSETLKIVNLNKEDIKEVLGAWGNGGPSEWEGGFVLELKDGRYCYIWGWNDYTGWGCQDGADIVWYDERPPLKILRGIPQHLAGYLTYSDPEKWNYEWDESPADLNRYIQGLTTEWD